MVVGPDRQSATLKRGIVTELRVGQGFDVHPFSTDSTRPLILGGVVLEGATGLVGHSDADAVAHAITDAVLGAAGLGDIGEHFPDTDATWKGADSMEMLAAAMSLVHSHGWRVTNVDTTVVLEAPKHRKLSGCVPLNVCLILSAGFLKKNLQLRSPRNGTFLQKRG